MLKHLLYLSYPICFICVGCSTKSIVHHGSLIITENAAYYSDDDQSIRVEAGSADKDAKAPQEVKQVPPNYPEDARKKSIEGEVQVKMLVMKDGTVKRPMVSQTSNSIFNKAALFAAMQWTFNPAEVNGRKINAWVLVPFNFRINK